MNNVDTRRDLTLGIEMRELAGQAIIEGRAGDEDVLVVLLGGRVVAIGAHCTHYKGPLAKGLIVGDTIRCPWHHACFNLHTGEAVRPPALDPVSCFQVERDGDRAFVREKKSESSNRSSTGTSDWPHSVVIVGGGGAGLAAAEMLRREGYDRPIAIVSADADPPCDRPNLSKDYLAGNAEEDWIPLRPEAFYADHRIELALNARVTALDLTKQIAQVDDGREYPFGALLLATGADPMRLTVPGADWTEVRYLRTFADSRAIIAEAVSAKQAVVVGASFIGLEVAASLRARGVPVTVVAPETRPMEKVLGADVGAFVQRLHEAKGVKFCLGRTVTRIDRGRVMLSDGTTRDADVVIVGIGVRPRLALAEQAKLALDRGVAVNEYLETSAPGVFAAGDIARWPDPHSGDRIRVEHWVVAERQGQTAARNMLGRRERFDAVPFFWSQHYDVTINYVGHAEAWDAVDIDGRLDDNDCTITYRRGGRTLAVATVFRDRASLEAEQAMEHERRVTP
jgi:NADPH-dependent 2,4-dienoyl-CoA reductase/sulfur reductase-like enzyme/nitrite reductase/ring-hydroxylating ferredoxin subunit